MSINWNIIKNKRKYIDDELNELDRAIKEENKEAAEEAFDNISDHAEAALDLLEG